jgi:hypothetical protein
MPLARPAFPRLAAAAVAAIVALAADPIRPAHAETIASGPMLLLGYSPDRNVAKAPSDLALLSFGWRWRRDGADFLDDFLAKGRIDFSWSVEALVGGVFGDAEAFEGSVVPYFRLAPLGWESVVPYFEAGIGPMFTSLRNYGLGSQIQFSDNVGFGVAFGGKDGAPRWSIGYRFRHVSHAGLFDDQNDGLNAHFLTFSME